MKGGLRGNVLARRLDGTQKYRAPRSIERWKTQRMKPSIWEWKEGEEGHGNGEFYESFSVAFLTHLLSDVKRPSNLLYQI